MKPPRPEIVIAILFAIAIYTLSQGPRATGADAVSYFVGVMLFPVLLSLLYVRWYRRSVAG